MDRETFEIEMCKARCSKLAGDRPDYWMGYQRGLRRRYHGEIFGTEDEHSLWMSLADDDTPDRINRGRGYRDGFNLGTKVLK